MNRQLLKDVILDQQSLLPDKALIERDLFKEIEKYKKTKQIVIVSGIRRCGKSTLLNQVRQKEKKANYYLNFDDDRLCQFVLNDFQVLFELFIELYGSQKNFYFDEIQNIDGWERFVRRLHDSGFKVYITGSNASMLSKELGTRLTGRYVQIELFPFSFTEYLKFIPYKQDLTAITTEKKGKIKRFFRNYIEYGGMPEYLINKNKEYLHFLYENILYRDIVARHSLSKEKELKELVFYLASNVGKEMSYNSLTKMLGLGSPRTTSEYCGYLNDSYLLFFVPRYNVSLKKQIQYSKKVYCIDSAIAQAVGFRFSEDSGRMLENLVFTELKRRKKEIFFHKEIKECDFLIKEGRKITTAIQCTMTLEQSKTKEREISGLIDALQKYSLKEGTILTEDSEAEEILHINKKRYKIHIIPIWKWLLNI